VSVLPLDRNRSRDRSRFTEIGPAPESVPRSVRSLVQVDIMTVLSLVHWRQHYIVTKNGDNLSLFSATIDARENDLEASQMSEFNFNFKTDETDAADVTSLNLPAK